MSWIDDLLERGVVPTSTVTLVPGILELSDAALDPTDIPPVNAELSGTVAIGNVSFDVTIHVPSLLYSVRKSQPGSGSWPLGALLADLGLGGLDLDELTVTDMVLAGSLRTGVLAAQVSFDAAQTWAPGSGPDVPLQLTDITVEVGTVGGASGAYAGISAAGSIVGTDLTADVSGTFDRNGWDLTASLHANSLDLEELLGVLGWGGDFATPEPPLLAAAELVLRYSTSGEKGVSLALDARPHGLPLGALLTDLVQRLPGVPALDTTSFVDSATLTEVTLDFAADGGIISLDVRAAGGFGTVSEIEERTALGIALAIALRKEGNASEAWFTGMLRPRLPLDPRSLVPPPVPLPDSMQIDVDHVVTAWRKDDDGSRFLIAFSIASVDAVQAEVPVIGRLFPEPGLTLGWDVVGCSAAFGSDDLGPINDVLEANGLRTLPETTRSGVDLGARLDLGLERLALPGGEATEPTATTPAAGPPATSSTPTPAVADHSATRWLPVQKGFGPVHVARAGLGYDSGEISFLLDASIQLAGLTLSLDGLGLTTPLDRVAPTVVLSGLGLEYASDAVTVAGHFVNDGQYEPEFRGTAIIRTKAFSLAATGAYRQIDGQASLFVFAAVQREFGGPPAFFVTGLAMGFGYNRDFVLPPLTDVERHPFLTAIDGATPVVADIPAKVGSYWLAAGIRFQSFGIIRSKAVALVRLSTDVEIFLLGLAELTLPRGTPARPYVRAELALRVTVKPAAGTAIAEAMLTDDSYVIDPACRITGNFAFALWFGTNEHRGDFVLSLGGYHPRFRPPDHYPVVPRLGLSWQNGPITIKGEAYFALTPSCVMAGGQLEAVYRQGALMAAFVLRAHFLIAWNPFSYDIEIGITVRAEFAKQTFLGTIRIGTTLGAQVRIWGPEFAGTARVNWSVFTFDVEFGAIDAAPPARTPLTWGEFRAAYLPADDAMCEIQIASGLRSIPDGTSDWVVDAGSLVVATRCAIPSSTVDLVDGDRAEQPIDDDPPPRDALLGIHPMGVSTFHSVHRVALRRLGSRGGHVDLVDNWRHGRALRQAVPKELWSPEPVAQGPSADVLRDRIVGLSDLRPDPQLSDDGPDAFPLSWFASQWDGRVRRVDMIASLPGQRPERPTDMFTRIEDTITSETVNADRLAAIERIRLHGFLAGEPADPVDPQLLAADVGNIFAVSPMLGGETGADPPADLLGGPSMVTHDVRVAERPRSIALPVPDVVARLLVELLAEFVERRYVDSGGAPSDGTTSIASIVTPADRPVALISDEVPQASLERALGAGTSAVFDLSRTGEEHARSYSELPTARLELGDDDELAARVITIDRAGRVADQAVTGTVVELSGTGQRAIARVIVSAHTPRAAGAANGWHGSSSLLRVAPRILVADGATVEVQTEDRHEVAAVRGAAAMRTNRVRTRSDGSDAPGWVKTTVPASAGTLAVYVRHDPGATGNGDARSAVVVEVTDEHGQVLRLVPAHAVHERADEVALLYRVPDSVRALSDTATYRTSLPAGPWVLDGIIAHDAEPQRVREAWQPGVTGLSPPPEPSAETRAVRLVRGAIAA